jgi:hypothetical protein
MSKFEAFQSAVAITVATVSNPATVFNGPSIAEYIQVVYDKLVELDKDVQSEC